MVNYGASWTSLFELVVTGLVYSRIRGYGGKMPIEQTQIIKRSIQYRAKYRIPGVKRKHNPGLVVPDPNNRGKDPMAPTHLREFRGTLALEGYDLIEANMNGVAVQQKPFFFRGAARGWELGGATLTGGRRRGAPTPIITHREGGANPHHWEGGGEPPTGSPSCFCCVAVVFRS